jgi:hypothetical protein
MRALNPKLFKNGDPEDRERLRKAHASYLRHLKEFHSLCSVGGVVDLINRARRPRDVDRWDNC